MTDADKVYVRFRGRTLGPLTSQRVQELIRRGQITRLHELSGDGLSWCKAEDFGSFFASTSVAPESAVETATIAAEEPIDSLVTAESSVNSASAAEPSVEWYAHVDGENQGPVPFARLQQWKESGHIGRETLVWRSGLDSWQPAQQVTPELFAADPVSSLENVSLDAGHRHSVRGSKDLSAIAMEMDQRRGWAFFFAVTLIVLSSLQMIGQLITVFLAASGAAAGVNTVPALFGALIGIAFAGTVMTAGILLLQYCSGVKEFALRPNQASALQAAKRLSSVWSFVGIACLIWLVILFSFLLVAVSIGLSVIDAMT